MDWMTATSVERLNEAGTEPPCPLCQRPRVRRSSYVRCNPCGANWFDGGIWAETRRRSGGRSFGQACLSR